MRIVTFAAGMAVGYVFGTRAGREKYQQIVDNARRLRDNPTAGQILEAARDLTARPDPAVAAVSTPAAAPAPSARAANAASKASRRPAAEAV